MRKTIYAGTYTKRLSKGIYSFIFEDGRLSDERLLCEIRNPKYLTRYKDKLIAVVDFEKGSGVILVDEDGKIIDQLQYEDGTSCYVTCKDDMVYTANYHEGTFSVLRIEDDKFRLIKKTLIKDKGGCHQVLLYKDLIMIPSLFLDRVMIYDQDLNKVKEIVLPEGSGPRHGVFTKDQKYLYLATELSNELFKIDMETFQVVDSIPVLLNGERNVKGTAAIRMSEDERYIYVSTRFKNVISVIDTERFELIQVKDCGGDHPRDFIVIGDHLLCANMNSDSVVVFDIKKGTLSESPDQLKVPEAIALCY
ncbi:MAG: beta-propeller fold lactonase family protein, partial [Erysipelotrichaceae bacterium]|nr:beta-propeller fold lactonase family protein [Erysipelotrichaceae bacterium]